MRDVPFTLFLLNEHHKISQEMLFDTTQVLKKDHSGSYLD